ncbi:MAG: SLC13 family permease, partial [Planctomycetes bacterium]|nr:SLC13 family permease [Planctomycetota bacterium]
VSRLLGVGTGVRSALARLMVSSAGVSAFLNNTPIVAALMPEVLSWCRKRQISASKILIPLSYATILGGMCTLIGTSTNLVIDGLVRETGVMAPLSLFELSWVGVPAAIVGITFVLTVGVRLLPNRQELLDQFGAAQREYIVEMLVESNCPLIGKSVQDAGLRHLPGLFLIEIDRKGEVIAPVSPADKLQDGDRLIFTGLVRTIVDLQRIPGLVPGVESHYDVSAGSGRARRLCEAVVSTSFPEIGRTIRHSNFRTRYDAVVVAVHRHGERIEQKIGEVILRPGDTLLLQAGEHFERTFRGSNDFYLVSEVQDSTQVRHERAWLATGTLLLLVVLLTWGVLSTAVSALIAAALMVLLRCVSVGVARRAVDWQVLVVIAAALGFAQAIHASGLDAKLADFVVRAGKQCAGPVGVLIGIYLLTNILTELISHIGAAALVFPIAMVAAEQLGVDPHPFVIAIAIAASASFATPIGYQTNLMVYGPGGYRFSDFIRIGLPMNVLIMIVAMLIIPRVWPLVAVQ